MKNKINVLLLLGMTCAGKDTIMAKCFDLSQHSHEYRPFEKVIAYTTRPIRDGETNGNPYYFISEQELSAMKDRGLLLTCKSFKTKFGVWHYALAQNSFDYNNTDKIYVSNADEFHDLIECEDLNIVSFYLDVPDEILMDRIKHDTKRDCEESMRRFQEDYAKFFALKDNCYYVISCGLSDPEEIARQIITTYNAIIQNQMFSL
jgi:guanylate kinase